MLEKIDLEKIFEAARQKGYSQCEVFAERTQTSETKISGKKCEVASFLESGIALRLFKETGVDIRTTNQFSTNSLLALFNQDLSQPEFSFLATEFKNAFFETPGKYTQALKAKMRKTGSELERERSSSALYQDKIRFFETIHSSGSIKKGREEEATLQIRYQISTQGKIKKVCEQISRNSISQLWKELEDDIFPAFRHPQSWYNPWPVPQGNLMVHWSSQAVAKVFLQFLRAFEGDLVLGNMSFLTSIPLAELAFSLEEKFQTNNTSFDQEGTLRRGFLLFKNGKPRGLACNNQIASQLEVSATGHARRENFKNEPTTGFWNVVISGDNQEENLMQKLTSGLSIHDIEILKFDPLSGDLTLATTDAVLVHHGEEGEAVERITLSVNLIELLSSFKIFSHSKKTWGFHITKGRQRFLTEIHAPEAFSPELFIPGSVPLSHYW